MKRRALAIICALWCASFSPHAAHALLLTEQLKYESAVLTQNDTNDPYQLKKTPLTTLKWRDRDRYKKISLFYSKVEYVKEEWGSAFVVDPTQLTTLQVPFTSIDFPFYLEIHGEYLFGVVWKTSRRLKIYFPAMGVGGGLFNHWSIASRLEYRF